MFSSIDRAASVLFPVGSRRFCHRQAAYSITFALAIIHTLLNSHLLYGFVVQSVNSTSNQTVEICHHRSDSQSYERLFSAYDSYVDVIKTNAIPFVIMSICNLIIIMRVCRSTLSSRGDHSRLAVKSKRKHEKDRQLTLMLLGSAIAFLVLTLPTEINDIIRSHSSDKLVNEKTYLLSAILLSLAHLNYAVRCFLRVVSRASHVRRCLLGPLLHLHVDGRSFSSTIDQTLADQRRLAVDRRLAAMSKFDSFVDRRDATDPRRRCRTQAALGTAAECRPIRPVRRSKPAD
jgi:hypothetical protein